MFLFPARLILGAACVIFFGGASFAADPRASGVRESVSIDMPHGGWRVAINVNGSGGLAYASLPQTVRFPPGTFDLSVVCSTIVAKVVNEDAKAALAQPHGTVRFDRNESLWYFNDWIFADQLFERAWTARIQPDNDLEREALKTLEEIWQSRSKRHIQ